MSTLPVYELELRASDQRKRLQASVTELKSKVQRSLDLKKTARQHLWLVGGVIATLSLAAGYAVTGFFTRH
jgi:hypothetical protein